MMHLLLIEDNPAEAFLLTDFLEKTENAPEVHWVTDGAAALDYVYQKDEHANAPRPDMILLDLSLPRIDGYDVLKELKSNPPFADIPVIVLTTSCSPLDQKQCEILGADTFLSKPSNLKGYDTLIRQLTVLQYQHLRRVAG